MTPYYDDGTCVIYHGEALAILDELPPASCDVLLTDPPYSSGGMFRTDRVGDVRSKYNVANTRLAESTFGGDQKDQWAWIRWVTAWSSLALRAVRPGGHAFVFSDWRQLPACTDAVQFGGWVWRNILVWDKTTTRPALGKFYSTLEFITWATSGDAERGVDTPSALFQVSPVRGNEREHVTQKPVTLLHHLLRVVPTCPVVILDPFMGSGSTLVAAKAGGHRSIGVDIDERYCEIAAKRLAQEVLDFGMPA